MNPSVKRVCVFLSTLLLCAPASLIRGKEEGAQRLLAQHDDGSSPEGVETSSNPGIFNSTDALSAILDALDVMQEGYFEVWQGVWPDAIDWTSAVMGTHVSAALSTLSRAFSYDVAQSSTLSAEVINHENTINRYFSQLVASYFGQNAFGLRGQAYDDMLWVVLGWLESIQFINLHSELHYHEPRQPKEGEAHVSWYGRQYIPSFAHRARIFWGLAARGWDTTLCDGGMIWSPWLTPYKNAITNELFVTASISMYLYFPGDDNTLPFAAMDSSLTEPAKAHDPKYLAAAIGAYKWLMESNMTDEDGLFIDGFHISGWHRDESDGSRKCDIRSEMVYTYNQGVLLSGQRGLWEATGARSYLEEGHDLIASVIAATGWNLRLNKVNEDDVDDSSKPRLGRWCGLGRSGILEDACDHRAQCSQDSQTFKGIFFHHLTLFCAPLPTYLLLPNNPGLNEATNNLKVWHDRKCASYKQWVYRNAQAARETADEDGKFGTWWGAPRHLSEDTVIPPQELKKGAVDYRSLGLPDDDIWRDKLAMKGGDESSMNDTCALPLQRTKVKQYKDGDADDTKKKKRDHNDRGRGRTIETQGGGVSVLRAAWEFGRQDGTGV